MAKHWAGQLEEVPLDRALYPLHKSDQISSDFGMDATAELLEGGFGLYSTRNTRKFIGPIKTRYYRIALGRTGWADFGIGLSRYRMQRDYMLFGSPGQVFCLDDFSEDFFTFYLLFTEAFIAESLLLGGQASRFPFLSYAGQQGFLIEAQTAASVESLILEMDRELKARQAGFADMIRLLIQQILLLCLRDYGPAEAQQQIGLTAQQSLYQAFLKAVGANFLKLRKVSAYAEMLYVSPDHLNRAIKACSAKTAHELIDDMLQLEAKAYLLHTDLSVSQLAYGLGFTDPSHFIRFFKKCTGQTPAAFRKRS